jgi:hypothetical protein
LDLGRVETDGMLAAVRRRIGGRWILGALLAASLTGADSGGGPAVWDWWQPHVRADVYVVSVTVKGQTTYLQQPPGCATLRTHPFDPRRLCARDLGPQFQSVQLTAFLGTPCAPAGQVDVIGFADALTTVVELVADFGTQRAAVARLEAQGRRLATCAGITVHGITSQIVSSATASQPSEQTRTSLPYGTTAVETSVVVGSSVLTLWTATVGSPTAGEPSAGEVEQLALARFRSPKPEPQSAIVALTDPSYDCDSPDLCAQLEQRTDDSDSGW